jgi:hypothetical protein
VLKRVLAAGTTTLVLSPVVLVPCAGGEVDAAGAARVAAAEATSWQKQTLVHLRTRSRYLQRVMHRRVTKLVPAARRKVQAAATPRQRARVLIGIWRRVYRRTQSAYRTPPFLEQLSCIQRGEGAWHDTRNPRYDGGLQMDHAFQARYGAFLLRRKGRAFNWTPLEQIWTAVYAISGPDHRGFSPWPLTARACDLI